MLLHFGNTIFAICCFKRYTFSSHVLLHVNKLHGKKKFITLISFIFFQCSYFVIKVYPYVRLDRNIFNDMYAYISSAVLIIEYLVRAISNNKDNFVFKYHSKRTKQK